MAVNTTEVEALYDVLIALAETTVTEQYDEGRLVGSEGGDIEIGDYICSSSIAGKGMKQDDDLLHNYTVAKALQKVVWADEVSTIKMISCTYRCG